VRVLFHHLDLLKQLLPVSLVKNEARVFFGHFNRDLSLIKLSGASEYYAESTSSEEVILVIFV
jgi:hypothetical protein